MWNSHLPRRDFRPGNATILQTLTWNPFETTRKDMLQESNAWLQGGPPTSYKWSFNPYKCPYN